MKQYLALFLLSIALLPLKAQETTRETQTKAQFETALSHYQAGQYAAAYRMASDLLENSNQLPTSAEEKASFIKAASSFRLNKSDAAQQLRDFVDECPLSTDISRAFLYMGIIQVNQGKYSTAAELLQRCDANTLSETDAEDYCYALANTKLKTGNTPGADTLFTVLIGQGGRYVSEATYYLAYINYLEGDYDEALKGFNKINGQARYRQSVPFFIMQIYFNQSRYKDVLTMTGNLKKDELDDVHQAELLRLQGAASYELADHHSSKVFYTDYTAKTTDIPAEDAYRIGMLYFMDKDYEHATDYLSIATINDDAVAQNATYHLGICYLQMNQDDMARMSFERASLSDYDMNTKEDALFNYALLCYKTSFSPFNEQVNAFERIIQEFPESKYSDQIYSYLSDAFLSTKNYEAAVNFIDRVKKPSERLLNTRSKLLFLLGTDKFDNGNYQQAIDKFTASITQATALKTSAVESYFWRGEALYRLGRLDEAKSDFSKFLSSKLSSKMNAWPLAHYNLAYCYFNSAEYDDALVWFNKYAAMGSIREDATYPDALNRIGDCYFHQRNYEQACSYYQKTDQLTPSGNDYAVYQQAFCLGLQKKYQEKASLMNDLVKRFPESQLTDDAIYEEGQAYVALEKPEKAINSFDALIEKYPNSPLSRKAAIQKGLLHYQMKHNDQAIIAYKKVISNYPGSTEATTALNDLKSIYVAINDVQGYVDYVASLGGSYAIKAEEQDSLLYTAAERLMMDDKQTEATQAFKNYLQKYPQGHYAAEANYYCGSLLNNLGFADEAETYLKAIVHQTGNKYVCPSLVILSENAYKSGMYAKALEYYRSLSSLTNDRTVRIGAKSGVMRCLSQLGQTETLVSASQELLQEKNLSPELQREARYNRAMSLLQLDRGDEAVKDLGTLSKESQTAYGAEARYRLAQYRFDQGETEKATSLAQSFLHDGTGHSYWLARTFLLLSDIYVSQNDMFQAKQYLQSLKENYTADDDIAASIESRLQAIEKRSTQE